MVTFSVNGIYTISYTDIVKGTISIPKDSIITSEIDIALIGKSRLNYGSYLDENVLHLLENFACPDINPSSPVGEPDISSAISTTLRNPTEGQMWFNKSNKRLYVLDNTSNWNPLKMPGDIAACSGIIANGQQIPLPSGMISYSQCSYVVSPQYVDQESNYIVCYADATGTVTARYRPTTSSNLIDGLANYIIIGNDNSAAVHYKPVVSVTPTLTPAPFSTVTPTLTQTPTITPTATITPVISPTAPVTRTATPSPTASPTPSPTPTYSLTPTVTKTATTTPTPTPTPSPVAYQTFILTAGYNSVYFGAGVNANYITAGFVSSDPSSPASKRGSVYDTPIGALSPSAFTKSGNSATIWGLEAVDTGQPSKIFTINLSGLWPQNFFSQIVFTDYSGILRTLPTSGASLYSYTQDTNPADYTYNTTTWNWIVPSLLFQQGNQYIITIYY